MTSTAPAPVAAAGADLPGELSQPGGRRRRDKRRRTWGDRVLVGFATLGFLYLFTPIVVIVLFSFNEPRGRNNIVWQRFTLDNWANPFAVEQLTDALINSLIIAVIAMVTAVVLGSLVALALSRYRFRGGAFINLFLVLPLTTPEIVLGASLATLFLNNEVQTGFTTLAIAHIMFCVSFVAMTVKARIRGFDWTLEDAAMDLGAPPLRTFWKVTFPMILPGVLAAGLLSFALSIDDYIITVFNRGEVQTFPVYVYAAQQRGIPPQVHVIATLILVVSVMLLALTTVGGRRSTITKTT